MEGGGRESPGPAAPLSLLTVIFIGLWVFFPICRWPWQGGQGPARGCAAPEPSGAAWLRREPLCSAGALGGSSAGGGAGRAAGRPATSLQEGRGVERFIYTNLLERTARVSCRDRTQGFFDQTWVCHGGRGLAVSPDRLLFYAAAGGCWAAASHASVSIKYRARTGCRVLCWGRVAPALLRGLRGCLRVRSHPAQAAQPSLAPLGARGCWQHRESHFPRLRLCWQATGGSDSSHHQPSSAFLFLFKAVWPHPSHHSRTVPGVS